MLWSMSAILLLLSGLALNECVNNLKIFFSDLTRVYIVYCSVTESLYPFSPYLSYVLTLMCMAVIIH